MSRRNTVIRPNWQSGLTLIELLVTMAIMGVVLTALLNWQIGTLKVTADTNVRSRSLADLNDVTGYIGDRVRAAEAIRTTGFTVNAASAVNDGKCDTTTPCLAVLVPVDVVPSGTGSYETRKASAYRNWMYLIYRVEPRGTWSAAEKVEVDAWADNAANNIVVLREYRKVCDIKATTPCSNVEEFKKDFTTNSSFSNMQAGLVMDHLTSKTPAGAAITPFTVCANKVTLRFQYATHVRGKTIYTPATVPYSLTVQGRNVTGTCP